MNRISFLKTIFDIADKYYLIAGTAFVLFYVVFKKRVSWKKIQPGFPRGRDYRREIFFSTLSIIIFALPPQVILQSNGIRTHSTFYKDISRHGWVYFFLAFPLMLLIHDTYFYWMHRFIHHPKLFKWFHLVHHRSTNPSPWAAYAFHPLEAFLESLIFVVFLFTIPVNKWLLLIFFVISLSYNVYGHLGYELYRPGFYRHWFGRWINTSVSHNMHHRYFSGNYGLYFLFWDRMMGTLRRDYDGAFRDVTERERQTGYGLKTFLFFMFFLPGIYQNACAQKDLGPKPQWIRPDDVRDPAVWGIRNGIVVGIWPAQIEKGRPGADGGPRGLLRIGYEYMGVIYHINYIAVEPVVDGDMEFSEVSPSQVDWKWGKFFWASDTSVAGSFLPSACARGKITHPDPQNPETEELSLYIFMEKFLDGAHPYLRLSIRSDHPGELGLEIFNEQNSAVMQRCALTATMGNYSRLRLLYLKDQVIDSRKLFAGYDDIEFAEKESYPSSRMLRNKRGDFIAVAEPGESFPELASWPQEPAYLASWAWRYRPFYKLTQYWRKELQGSDSSLVVRVNGRAKYWSGGSDDKSRYINIPGGPAFENFELRENYHAGQKFYFGLTQKTAKELIGGF
ncbi:MAG: sterol desaturase family protein [Puia sp.]|nr:sterol desaturase family protein [Puia sp.]